MPMKRRILIFALSTVIVAVTVAALARCQRIQVAPSQRLAAYDPAPYADLLAATVHDGLVDYAELRRGYAAQLDQYLDAIGRFGPNSSPEGFPSPEHELAYYLNAYNAIMLRKWLNAGAGEYESDAGHDRRFVNKLWFVFDQWRIDRDWISLDTLEQTVIRPEYQEPRIHFALVCGAMSCPPLLDEPFDAARLDDQLETLGRRWLRQPDALVLEEDGGISMSSIFSWYRSDFDSMDGLSGVLERYLDADDPRRAQALEAARASRILFLAYDWSINESR